MSYKLRTAFSALHNAAAERLLDVKLPAFIENVMENERLGKPPLDSTNLNEERIYQYELIYLGKRYVPVLDSMDKYIVENDDVRTFWHDIKNLILLRRVLNFSLLTIERHDLKQLCFPIHTINKINFPIFVHTNKIADPSSIVFQKLMIFYTLQTLGFSSLNYKYQIVPGPKNKVTYVLKDFVFELQLPFLVYLSPETILTKESESLSDFIDKLEPEERNYVLAGSGNSLYETLVVDFTKYLNQKAMFNMRMIQNIYENSPETKHVREGYLYLIKEDDKKPVYMIITQVAEPFIEGYMVYENQPAGGISLIHRVLDRTRDMESATFFKVNFLKSPQTPGVYMINLS
ncbi:putative internal virion protein [Diachasmimorpha longicaudata entomopoxvirus]|uniref:Putative internal virion protein n=1 Tax=Diachasmimorpha longicaudata entomopoxvirus TaxID=109981 RepID=A0A7R5WCZ5_9POXV|nr:putative internal virion protein [Diachasmimorpha longicaudata entomopoxvirus]AKS26352.1 putative internal virion protein [Diachasmimorpha longicaudata entomopoxvirus]